jgi:hypothetical protein
VLDAAQNGLCAKCGCSSTPKGLRRGKQQKWQRSPKEAWRVIEMCSRQRVSHLLTDLWALEHVVPPRRS